MAFPNFLIAALLAVSLTLQALPINAQIVASPCSASMLTTFTPCLNYITNSSPNGGSPSADCCNIMKSVVGDGVDCLCFIASGGVPFRIPINRNLTLSLPRACQTPGVSIQCKASGTPSPASSPVAGVPTLPMSPKPAPGPSRGPAGDAIQKPLSPGLAPESDATPTLTPPSPTTISETPATNTGSRVSPVPSAAPPRCPSALLMLAVLGALVFKLY